MRKRILLFLLVIGAVLGLLVAGAFREREPKYGGKRLSQWVEGIILSTSEDDHAEEALPHIGTNAIPFLVKWIEYDPLTKPNCKIKLFWKVERIVPYRLLAKIWQYEGPDRQHIRASGARIALERLGSEAIPSLFRLMNDTNFPIAAMRKLVSFIRRK